MGAFIVKNIARGALALLLILAAAACDKTTTQGSGGKKLTLDDPADQTLHRGDTNKIDISISRENFSGPVSVRFQRLPKGVEVLDTEPIPADQSRATYTLHATNDADLVANFEASVEASSGPEGTDKMAATQTFLITVKDKT